MTADTTALQLFELYRERLRAFLSRQRLSTHDMEEVMQEVFLRFARQIERHAAINEPGAYLFGIAHKVIAERHRPPLPVAADEHPESPGPEHAVDSDKLLRALDALRPVEKAVIVLWYRDDLSDKEIGRRLDLSPHTVRTYRARALVQLRALMGEPGNSEVDRG